MNRISRLLLTIAFSGFSSLALSAPITLDFDSTSPGSYTEGTLGNADVSFDNTGGTSFNLSPCNLDPDFSCGNAILNSPYTTAGNSTIATFSSLASFVSVVLGDYNADSDNLYLYAYDAFNNLLGSDSFANPASSSAGHTLSISAANIAWVEFYGVGANNNSVYWDNFTYDVGSGRITGSVPEPGSLSLFLAGLLGVLFSRATRKA